MDDIKVKRQLSLLFSCLKRISTDSLWAHRASGSRGDLLKYHKQLESGYPVNRLAMLRHIQKGFLAIIIMMLLNNCAPATQTAPPIISPSITPTTIHVVVPTPTVTPLPVVPIKSRFAWFYKPPSDKTDLLTIVNQFQFFILSRGNEEERDQLLALGAQRPVFQYIRFDAIHDPHDCDARPRQNQAAYKAGDFCRISEEHPDWFLLNLAGERIIHTFDSQDYVMMDPGNPGWREFFLKRVKESQFDPNWGGVFLDNVEVTFSFREDRGQLPAIYPEEENFHNAVQGFLQYLYSDYFQPSKRQLIANIVARKNEADFPKYLTWLDGAMHEGWATDWPNRFREVKVWEEQMTVAEQTQAMGKFIILVSQGTQYDTELQKFAFASYLLVNQGNAAFRYALSGKYSEVWLYSNYHLDLGIPTGKRYKKGDTWYRNYSNGIVTVNPVTHEADIKVLP